MNDLPTSNNQIHDIDYADATTPGQRRSPTWFRILAIGVFLVGIGSLIIVSVTPWLGRSYSHTKENMAQRAVSKEGAISTAIKNFDLDLGRYPETLDELFKKPDDEAIAAKWTAPFLDVDPVTGLKDVWGSDYEYRCPARFSAEGFDLWSCGPNGISGDADDIRNW